LHHRLLIRAGSGHRCTADAVSGRHGRWLLIGALSTSIVLTRGVWIVRAGIVRIGDAIAIPVQRILREHTGANRAGIGQHRTGHRRCQRQQDHDCRKDPGQSGGGRSQFQLQLHGGNDADSFATKYGSRRIWRIMTYREKSRPLLFYDAK